MMLAHQCRPWITRAIAEVLESMCFIALEGEAALPPRVAPDWVARRLDFQGPRRGSFGIYSPRSTARIAASNFLGEDPDQVADKEAEEILGEIANMACGTFLGLTHAKQHFDLSPPQADSPWIHTSSTACRVSQAFAIDPGVLVAWLEMEPCQ